jgi:hypothetical protein
MPSRYDAAQERGEVKGPGNPDKFNCPQKEHLKSTVTDIGLTYKQVHEARNVRDAEKKKPGTIQKKQTQFILILQPLPHVDGEAPPEFAEALPNFDQVAADPRRLAARMVPLVRTRACEARLKRMLRPIPATPTRTTVCRFV